MSSLRDALKKAGFTEAKPEAKPETKKEEKREERNHGHKPQNTDQRDSSARTPRDGRPHDRRPPLAKGPHHRQGSSRPQQEENRFVKAEPPVKKHEHHFKTRTFCDQCQKTFPDVELYEQRGRTKWMCVLCADELMILDENRRTAQSDFSKKGMFRRQYGRTLPPRIIEAKAEEARAREQKFQASSPEEKKPVRRFNDQAPRERHQNKEGQIKKDDKK